MNSDHFKFFLFSNLGLCCSHRIPIDFGAGKRFTMILHKVLLSPTPVSIRLMPLLIIASNSSGSISLGFKVKSILIIYALERLYRMVAIVVYQYVLLIILIYSFSHIYHKKKRGCSKWDFHRT